MIKVNHTIYIDFLRNQDVGIIIYKGIRLNFSSHRESVRIIVDEMYTLYIQLNLDYICAIGKSTHGINATRIIEETRVIKGEGFSLACTSSHYLLSSRQ